MAESEFMEVAIAAAKAGGDVLMRYFRKEFSIEFKADRSPVTDADRESEHVIIETIRKRFPDHAFLGEESGAEGESEHTWIIDPLDGTLLFSHAIPEFVVLLALMHKEEIVLGVAYSPVQRTLITATKGEGCFIDGKKVSVSRVERMEDAYCIHEYLDGFNREPRFLPKLISLIPSVRSLDIVTIRAGYRYFLEGKVDAVIVAGVHPWDVVPYALMAQEAGGVATDLRGEPVGKETTSLLLANKALHPKLLESFKGA